MTDPIVYRTTDPKMVQLHEAWMAAREAFSADLVAVADDVDPDGRGREMLAVQLRDRAQALGLKPDDADRNPNRSPRGWRHEFVLRHRVLVPIRRSKAGKEMAARIEALNHPDATILGMPRDSWVESTSGYAIHRPSIGLMGGVVYVKWHGDVDLAEDRTMSDGEGVDTSMWERCPLSEFYAAVEKLETSEATS